MEKKREEMLMEIVGGSILEIEKQISQMKQIIIIWFTKKKDHGIKKYWKFLKEIKYRNKPINKDFNC